MAMTPARDTAAIEPDRGPPRWAPVGYGGHVQPATAEAYRGQAALYDGRTESFQHWRERLIALLPARPGDTVLDVGCGTGLCIALLHDKVGPTGALVGIDASEQMLQVAADRVATRGWDTVRLLEAPVERAPIDGLADAAMFCAVHDVLQSRAALGRVFGHLRPGAAVAAGGGKLPGPWLRHMRGWVRALHAPFVADFTGFDKPWQLLAEFVPDLQVHEHAFGAGYLASGHYAPATR